MENHYKEFFELVKDYYQDLDEVCAALDNDKEIPDPEQLRLALHTILDAADSINESAFWAFMKGCTSSSKKIKK